MPQDFINGLYGPPDDLSRSLYGLVGNTSGIIRAPNGTIYPQGAGTYFQSAPPLPPNWNQAMTEQRIREGAANAALAAQQRQIMEQSNPRANQPTTTPYIDMQNALIAQGYHPIGQHRYSDDPGGASLGSSNPFSHIVDMGFIPPASAGAQIGSPIFGRYGGSFNPGPSFGLPAGGGGGGGPAPIRAPIHASTQQPINHHPGPYPPTWGQSLSNMGTALQQNVGQPVADFFRQLQQNWFSGKSNPYHAPTANTPLAPAVRNWLPDPNQISPPPPAPPQPTPIYTGPRMNQGGGFDDIIDAAKALDAVNNPNSPSAQAMQPQGPNPNWQQTVWNQSPGTEWNPEGVDTTIGPVNAYWAQRPPYYYQ